MTASERRSELMKPLTSRRKAEGLDRFWGRSCAGDQFLAGTKNIWWLSLCVDPLPVAGQVVLMLESLARLSGRFLSLYTCPMLCFPTGPSFKITETAMSCVPPHLLQRAKILYFVVGGIASSFSRMVVL